MNRKRMLRVLGFVLLIEAAAMVPSLLLTGNNGDHRAMVAFLQSVVITGGIGALFLALSTGGSLRLRTWESVYLAALSWVLLCLFGALPFYLSGRIPSYIDSLFEITSGFTTTGSSILSDVEGLGKGLLFWRSLSHWIGGIGVISFFLAILPSRGNHNGYSADLIRAESPGPVYNKLVPRIRRSTELIVLIYIALTLVNIILLKLARMPLFDACCIGFGTAGTGGFSVRNSGMNDYTIAAQVITTIFMLLFGVNFSLYFLAFTGKIKEALKDQELRFYGMVVGFAILFISLNVWFSTDAAHKATTVKDAAFTVASIITTTGFATADFNLWPTFSKAIILILMIIGGCAGSTAGGLKVVRVLVTLKTMRRSIKQKLYPNKIMVVRLNGHRVPEDTILGISTYISIYILIIAVSFLMIAADPAGQNVETTFTAVLSSVNNIGPGLSGVGPMENFGDFHWYSKLIMIIDMLLGRLEIYPIAALLTTRFLKNTI